MVVVANSVGPGVTSTTALVVPLATSETSALGSELPSLQHTHAVVGRSCWPPMLPASVCGCTRSAMASIAYLIERLPRFFPRDHYQLLLLG